MSIATEITRITTARNTIRTKLTELGMVSAAADIDDCALAVDGIARAQSLHRYRKEIPIRYRQDITTAAVRYPEYPVGATIPCKVKR